ncbi:type IV pili methyl-accepting chemotaxis transducer N-terminal domain-containing protein [Roseobacter weihaiensis]|uniref:type IV pili methyl-accepting chemotaxis transducer N-terminal domain-containing protein n=1 Tax=Roseobacter weihaiensis TaxID=2763262 RepID=UPI001D0BD2AA|nr:type IV pili methyl-accepting chemotaxis transducer N-terminal domain-containing protein [Roseobacter sp. H9]
MPTHSAEAQEITPETDARNRINYSGRQRMLTQQIARNACFVMADIEPERFAAKAETAAQQFDTALVALRDGDAELGLLAETNDEVLKDLEAVETLWSTLGPAVRQIAAGDLHSVPMLQMIRLNLQTLTEMHETVLLIQSVYGDGSIPANLARTINLAGRQRMLSQKASKEVCLYVLGISGGGGKIAEIDATIGAFDRAMAELLEGSKKQGILAPPNRQIKKQLERTEKAWRMFKTLMIEFEKNPDLPAGERVRLANLSDQVLLEMDLAVRMYSEL